jgi:type II secretory pathway component PulJ
MLSRGRQRGLGLIELMVAITLGLFILAGILLMYSEMVRSHAAVLKTAHLQQTLWSLLTVIAEDVRRAGYWSRAELTVGGTAVDRYAPIHITDDGGCILYSYDEDKDDADGMPDAADQQGFRIEGGGVQIKTSDAVCGATTCTDCGSGNWFLLTDPQGIRITALSFTADEHAYALAGGTRAIVAREIGITLEGEIAGDPGVHQRVTTSVGVRNHEIR